MDYQSFQPGGQNLQAPLPPIPELPQSQNLSERLRPYRWHIAISGLIVIALLFGVYSYLKYINQQNDAAVAKQAEDAQKKIDEIYQKRTQDPTADWKTYNVQNAFEVKYPNNLELTETDKTTNNQLYISYATIKIRNNSEIRVMVLNPNSYETPDNYYKKYINGYPGAKKIIISGREAWQDEPGGSGYFIDTVIFNAPNIFEVMYASNDIPTQPDRQIYNQILSTFKFTR